MCHDVIEQKTDHFIIQYTAVIVQIATDAANHYYYYYYYQQIQCSCRRKDHLSTVAILFFPRLIVATNAISWTSTFPDQIPIIIDILFFSPESFPPNQLIKQKAYQAYYITTNSRHKEDSSSTS